MIAFSAFLLSEKFVNLANNVLPPVDFQVYGLVYGFWLKVKNINRLSYLPSSVLEWLEQLFGGIT